MNYVNPGFSPDLEEDHAKEEDHIFGATLKIPSPILVPDGDWREFEPVLEIQKKRFDSYSCVSFANLNVTEFMHKKLYGEEINYSDRFMSVMSNTKPGVGNSHVRVAETRRTKGSVLESDCPFTDSMTQAQFFTPITQSLQDKGLKWFETYEYGHEKVRRSDFLDAIQCSPLQVAVDSRTNRTSQVRGLDHSVTIKFIDKVKKKNHVYDSYLNRVVEYDWDYPFGYGTRAHYRKIFIIKLDGMELKLVKGDQSTKIYLVDFEGTKHHVDDPKAFVQIFSKTAWDRYGTLPQAEVDAVPEGVKISVKGVGLIEALKSLINTFGKKKGKK